MHKQTFVAVALLLGLVNTSHAATTLRRAVMGNGGTGAASAQHVLRSTLGQPAAQTVSATQHSLSAGFWHPGLSPSSTPDVPALPREFALRSIAPNPFSRSTEVHFDVPAGGGHVVMRIFDVHGRLVRTLTNGSATPGAQFALWDGSDDAGHRLGVGIYLLSFEAPGRRASRKLVLLP